MHRWSIIRAKMEAAATVLEKQGSMASRMVGSQRHWSVRYVDRTCSGNRQRAIHVGSDPEIIRRARELLAEYRERGGWADEAAAYARIAGSLAAALKRVVGRRRRKLRSGLGLGQLEQETRLGAPFLKRWQAIRPSM